MLVDPEIGDGQNVNLLIYVASVAVLISYLLVILMIGALLTFYGDCLCWVCLFGVLDW